MKEEIRGNKATESSESQDKELMLDKGSAVGISGGIQKEVQLV